MHGGLTAFRIVRALHVSMRKLTAHSIEVTSTHPWQTSPSGVLYVSMFFSSDKQPEARVAARFVFIGVGADRILT